MSLERYLAPSQLGHRRPCGSAAVIHQQASRMPWIKMRLSFLPQDMRDRSSCPRLDILHHITAQVTPDVS